MDIVVTVAKYIRGVAANPTTAPATAPPLLAAVPLLTALQATLATPPALALALPTTLLLATPPEVATASTATATLYTCDTAIKSMLDGTPTVTALAEDGSSRMAPLPQCHDDWLGATKTK
eukprot:SAG31_NODE_2362_length_5864_cov_5.175195_3_plen_120_part_00